MQPNLLPEATGGDGTVLTSGYFFSSVRGVAKCLHGLVSPGIAKDLPIGEGKYNRAAEDLATRHTEQFVQSIIEQLLGDTKALRGVFGSFTVLGNDMNLVPSHVFKGERYEFKTNPEGRVTWGFNSPLGLSNPISSGPGGTPNISAGNYYWYKPPPLPLEPVGALIGSIYSKDCDFGQPAALAPPDLPSTLCSPKHIFMIGEARKVTIEVSGRLYLHVNDSNLANNGGYFETIFTLIPRAGR